jgi:hypothetical protein
MSPEPTTDPTTQRMKDETGHDCITCPTDVRNLMATAHNAIGALDAARKGTGSWERAWRKVERLRAAEAQMGPVSDAHFEALNEWRRPVTDLTTSDRIRVREVAHSAPVAVGRCRNCGDPVVYNLAIDYCAHQDADNDTTCTDPWPATSPTGDPTDATA